MIPSHTCKRCGTFIWAFTTKRFTFKVFEHYGAFLPVGESTECEQVQKAQWKGAF